MQAKTLFDVIGVVAAVATVAQHAHETLGPYVQRLELGRVARRLAHGAHKQGRAMVMRVAMQRRLPSRPTRAPRTKRRTPAPHSVPIIERH
jgi:hypothetical protein